MIPVIHIPSSGTILRKPTPEPVWDSEWFQAGSDAPLRFFLAGVGRPFEHYGVAHARIGRSHKTLSDTNVRRIGFTFLPFNGYDLERIVLYPWVEVAQDHDSYKHDVEHLRQNGVLRIRFGDSIYSEFPLRDAMPNFAPEFEGESFDPSESPDLRFRRGVDIRVHLTSDKELVQYALRVCRLEHFWVEVDPCGPAPEVGIRAYLVGTHLKAIQG